MNHRRCPVQAEQGRLIGSQLPLLRASYRQLLDALTEQRVRGSVAADVGVCG
jgi:hypothetical protein